VQSCEGQGSQILTTAGESDLESLAERLFHRSEGHGLSLHKGTGGSHDSSSLTRRPLGTVKGEAKFEVTSRLQLRNK